MKKENLKNNVLNGYRQMGNKNRLCLV